MLKDSNESKSKYNGDKPGQEQNLLIGGGRRGLMDIVLSQRPGGPHFESRLGQIV